MTLTFMTSQIPGCSKKRMVRWPGLALKVAHLKAGLTQARVVSARNTTLPGKSPNQGPPEGRQLPTTSRVGGPWPLSDSASTAGPTEPSFSELVPQLFTGSSLWQNMTPRTRARQLWLLLRTGLHDFVEKVRLSCGFFLEDSSLVWLFP